MTREDLICSLHLNGVGVEIGVWDGYFSHFIIKNSKFTRFYSVDAWDAKYTKEQLTQRDSDEAFKSAQLKLAQFRGVSQLVKLPSLEAACLFKDDYFDFIYIDASHDYASVKNDVNIWWKKLKYGGIFSGHDYCEKTNYGVISAVNEFMRASNQTLNLTDEPVYKSWWVKKAFKVI